MAPIPIGEWSGSAATDELRETIVQLQAEANRKANVMIGLTIAIVVLTVVLIAMTGVLLSRPA